MDYSAKVAEDNEVTPQSNYVWIREHGHCEWAPRYDLSVTHCTVDVTWFPFDEQTCDLTFESWMLDAHALKIVPDNNSVGLQDFKEPEGWYLLGSYRGHYKILLNCVTFTMPSYDNNLV